MKTAKEIRRAFIEFYTARDHKEIPSASLVPENDPTTLFTGSGMQPLVPYLLGEPHPLGTRLVDSQLSFRAEDLDEVGDNRHTTFFEMLGNWSLGDYFKKEQLNWFAEFLIEVLKLPAEKLYVTVFAGDEFAPKDTESIEIWQSVFKKYGTSARVGERIFEYDSKKNWWSRSGPPENMPVGEPGGPDSEVFYDFGTPHDSRFGEICHVNCDCGRFMELGNSVFMQYKKTEERLRPLPKKNVDFGGGLERFIAASENQPDFFKTSLFKPIIKQIVTLANKQFGQEKQTDRSMRIIADHIRGATFLIASGIEPANKLQGYMLRRLIRRSILYGNRLGFGLSGENIAKIAQKVVAEYRSTYANLFINPGTIYTSLTTEGVKFAKTLDKGLKEIEKIKELDGKNAFYLYESFGFPLELTLEIAKERGQNVDTQVFNAEFERHKNVSRSASAGMFKGGLADKSGETVKLHTANHLLQAALRQILGTHVRQKGSNITVDRLRFDFTHPTRLSKDELEDISDAVNQKIEENLAVSFEVLDYHQAIKQGALSVPGEKYPEKVKVYSIGAFSMEICGGPHVSSTKQLGRFKITKEEGAGSGIRRIYATLSA